MSWPGSNGEKQVENRYDEIVPEKYRLDRVDPG